MVFSSIEFIFIFFPLFLIAYYAVPYKMKNACLLLGSILFYTVGSIKQPIHILLFLFSVLGNYLFGRMIEKYHNRISILAAVFVNLLYLCSFKYFFQILPIGISFYTFQAISYLLDIFRRKCHAETSFINFATYLSMFPQLIAGPIVQYTSIQRKLHERNCNFADAMQGLRIFILGLGSKVLLANQVGILWNQLSVIGYDSISVYLAWLGLIAYTFQIYFDFWGYSLMAIGLGKMLGFDLPQNFDYPYLSTSMTEFWRRWHMTLGSWFREYVYIPLGGNKGGKGKEYRNLFLVWMLTGIWHGAGGNFLLWGFFLFVLIALEKAGWKKFLDRHRILGHIYMVIVIPLSWAIFAHNDWDTLWAFIKRLFGCEAGSGFIYQRDFIKYGRQYGIWLLLCLLFSTRIPQKIWKKLENTYAGQLILALLFAGVVYCLYIGLDNPFLYYQF